MNEWDNIDRRLGPSDPVAAAEPPAPELVTPPAFPTPFQAQGESTGQRVIEPLHPPVFETLPAIVPSAPAAEDEWTAQDEFDPRYCTVCHRKIPRIVSERHEMCHACMAARGLSLQPLPVTGSAIGSVGPPVVHCPMCAGTSVEREWITDWVSAAVDIVAGAASIGTMLFGGTQRLSSRVDWSNDVGHVKVMRHLCSNCGYKWVE